MTRYQPILPINLDPRNESQLANYVKRRMVIASDGRLSDISPASVPSIIAEGVSFSGAQLLNSLNRAPEAWTADWLRTQGFLQIASAPAIAGVVFTRSGDVSRGLIIPQGTRAITPSGVVFKTNDVVDFLPNETSRIALMTCEEIGTIGNVGPGEINRLLVSVTNLTVSNPVAAYGGLDGETWAETKSRAFGLLRRRNPVSVSDWEDFFRQVLGINTQVVVIPGSATPSRLFKTGITNTGEVGSASRFLPTEIGLPYDGSAEGLLNAFLEYQNKANISFDAPTQERLVNRLLSTHEYNTRYNNHMFVFLRNGNNTSLDVPTLERLQEIVDKSKWVGTQIHIENARVDQINVNVYLEDEPPAQASSVLRSVINNYFLTLDLGSPIEYNDLLNRIDRVYPTVSIEITRTTTAYNEGLPSETLTPIPSAKLSGSGLVQEENSSTTRFIRTNKLNPYFPYSAFKLSNLVISKNNPGQNLKFGDILACYGSTSMRQGLDGAPYYVENDIMCSEGGN